jgi:hypothetical protein
MQPQPHDLVFFVSSVAGRLVSRPGAPHAYIGARITTAEEMAAGSDRFAWDSEAVVPFSRVEFARYERELSGAVRRGDLVKRSAEDFTAWGKVQESRETERLAAIKATEDKAAAEAKRADGEAKKLAKKGAPEGSQE